MAYEQAHRLISFACKQNQRDERKVCEMMNRVQAFKMVHGSMVDEIFEQVLALTYLTGHETVLEIGGNLGRNSMVIATMLTDPQRLVVLESSQEIAHQLRENVAANPHLGDVHVEASALTRHRMFQKGWSTSTDATFLDTTLNPNPTDTLKEVSTITWEALTAKYPTLSFDTLVLDCEGAFFYIVQEFPSIMNNIKLVIVENDYTNLAQKRFVDCVFEQHGLKRVFSIGIQTHLKFECAPEFYEVWRKD
jgi:FkbM family methyltransferase